MQKDLVRWERAIEEGIDIPSEIKAESDLYRLNYDELIKICTLSKLYDQDYYSVCSQSRFWGLKLEYDILQSEMTHQKFLKLSLRKGWTIYVGILLKSPLVNLNKITSNLIFDVIENGYYNIIKLLLNDKKTKNLVDVRDINNAIISKQTTIAFLLMENLDVNSENYIEILKFALWNSNKEIIEHILNMNMNLNQTNIKDIFNAAGLGGNFEILQLIIDHGFTLEGKNLHNALIGAAKGGRVEMMQYLLELGADPTYNNYNAFWQAFDNYKLGSIRILLDTGKISNIQINHAYQTSIVTELTKLKELLEKYRK